MTSTERSVGTMLLVAAAVACAAPATPPDPAYVGELEQWYADRETRLTEPDGWLAVVGLFWLSEGPNRFGTDPGLEIVLPESAGAPQAGTITLEDQRLTVRAEPGVDLRMGSEPVSMAEIASDAEDLPDVLRLGEIRFYVIERGNRFAVRVKDPASAARKAFSGVERFPADLRFLIEAEFEAYDPPRKTMVPTIIGVPSEFLVPGVARFEIDGAACALEPVLASPDSERLFFIFSDPTNGEETYGAGRFLYAEREREGKVVLDFNRAVNPPCAFTDFATCPLPPPQNALVVRVEAGEKAYGSH